MKKSIPFQPPKSNKFIPFTKVQEWPYLCNLLWYLADGEPLPSGPWYHVKVYGSKACKSLKTVFSPFPPKIIILDPAKIAECWYLGAGGVPEILFFFYYKIITLHLFVFTFKI